MGHKAENLSVSLRVGTTHVRGVFGPKASFSWIISLDLRCRHVLGNQIWLTRFVIRGEHRRWRIAKDYKGV